MDYLFDAWINKNRATLHTLMHKEINDYIEFKRDNPTSTIKDFDVNDHFRRVIANELISNDKYFSGLFLFKEKIFELLINYYKYDFKYIFRNNEKEKAYYEIIEELR